VDHINRCTSHFPPAIPPTKVSFLETFFDVLHFLVEILKSRILTQMVSFLSSIPPSSHPPSLPLPPSLSLSSLPSLPQFEVGYETLESLPEYQIHEQKFTQLLDRLDRQNLVLSRYRARVELLGRWGDASARKVRDF
jgi:hypothetical protein